jgi:hypothetical protein
VTTKREVTTAVRNLVSGMFVTPTPICSGPWLSHRGYDAKPLGPPPRSAPDRNV